MWFCGQFPEVPLEGLAVPATWDEVCFPPRTKTYQLISQQVARAPTSVNFQGRIQDFGKGGGGGRR